MDDPLLIVVTGMPGAGKTTLANALSRELRLPLVAKDEIKEILFDNLGAKDVTESQRLGQAAHALIFGFLHNLLRVEQSAVAEANFFRGKEEPKFVSLPPHRLVQVHCIAPLELLVERFSGRSHRHGGHFDRQRVHELAGRFESDVHLPLDLDGDVVEVDTSRPVRLPEIVARISTQPL